MKKAIFFVCTLLILPQIGLAKWNTPYHSINENDLESVSEGLHGSTNEKTAVKMVNYMSNNYYYATDMSQFGAEDYWQSPEEMFHNKKGDCEDSAILMSDILKRNGIDSEVWYVGNRYKYLAHAIVITSLKKGEFDYLDNSYNIHPYQTKKESIFAFWGQKETGTNGPLYSIMGKPNSSKTEFPTTPVKVAENVSLRLKMHSHLTECEGNEIEIILPVDDYCQLVHKQAIGLLAKINSRVIKGVGFSYSEHGWYSPSSEYNDKMYSFHLLFPHVGVTFNTGDYEGIDIDVNPISSKWLSAYVNMRNFGEVCDYKMVLTPIKCAEGQVELNDNSLGYCFYLKMFNEGSTKPILKLGINDKSACQIVFNPEPLEIQWTFAARPFVLLVSYKW